MSVRTAILLCVSAILILSLISPVAAQDYSTWRLTGIHEWTSGEFPPGTTVDIKSDHADAFGGSITIAKQSDIPGPPCNGFVNFYTYHWEFNPKDVSVVYGRVDSGTTVMTIYYGVDQKYQDPDNCITGNYCLSAGGISQEIADPSKPNGIGDFGFMNSYGGAAICAKPLAPGTNGVPAQLSIVTHGYKNIGFMISTNGIWGIPKEGGWHIDYWYVYTADEPLTETQSGSAGGTGGGTTGGTSGGTSGGTTGGTNPTITQVSSGACTSDWDCPDNQICQNGACVAAPSCLSDADCQYGQVCQGGACVAAPTGNTATTGCRFDADCPGAEVCRNGACQMPECFTDTDCGIGEACQSHNCVVSSSGNSGPVNQGQAVTPVGAGVVPTTTIPLSPLVGLGAICGAIFLIHRGRKGHMGP